MNPNLRKTLIAGAVTALFAMPAWSAGDTAAAPDEAPRVETEQPMDTAPQRGSEPDAAAPMASQSRLYDRTPEELRRVEVIDPAGESVGRIKTVVLGPERESAHAVISSGGFLGLGARELIVSLDELELIDDKLHIAVSKEALEARGDYVPEQYVELEPDRPISEFSAFEPLPEAPPAGAPTLPQAPE
ncbi:MAG TPA: PRC-barrel domain-containing protein [Rhodocyclaceae bacterium]|nr:PRC-barrel domain-containing protein [Rhodocyclaceae bacterium]